MRIPHAKHAAPPVAALATLVLAHLSGPALAGDGAALGATGLGEASAMYVPWGAPGHTVGDDCSFPWPAWALRARRDGGAWVPSVPSWRGGEGASLRLELDRSALGRGLDLLLWCSGDAPSVTLLDAGGEAVSGELEGRRLGRERVGELTLYRLPLEDLPAAAVVAVSGHGELEVFGTLLFAPAPQTAAETCPEAPAQSATRAAPAPRAAAPSRIAPPSRVAPPARATAPSAAAPAPPQAPSAPSAGPAGGPAAAPSPRIASPAHGSRILW